MKMTRSLLVLIVGALLVVTAACGGGEPPAPTGGATSADSAPATTTGGGTGTAAPAGAGSIRGSITYQGTAPAPEEVKATKDKQVCGKHTHTSETLVVDGNGGIRYAVVSIDPVQGGKSFDTETPQLDQRGCWFYPHIQIVPAGVDMEILNSDGILHNLHTYPENNPAINMAQPKFRKVLKTSFAKPDIVRVSCDVHNWMNAWIIVAKHPYYVVTSEDGSYELDGVPPGTYTLTAWHETLGTQTQSVTVEKDGTAEANLTFGG